MARFHGIISTHTMNIPGRTAYTTWYNNNIGIKTYNVIYVHIASLCGSISLSYSFEFFVEFLHAETLVT